MAYTAHFITPEGAANRSLVVRDDRGVPAHEIQLPERITQPGEADGQLREFGWERSAGWTEADDGWVAPVVEA